MKLYYTNIENDLTNLLAKQALDFVSQGKRVFYIAPNSLSFEKEKRVLKLLPTQVSLDLMVTRFGQMARYFVWTDAEDPETAVDDTGLSMLFYRVLSQIQDGELQLYGQLRRDRAFVEQLVVLYKELLQSNMTISDFQALPDSAKAADLQLIFSRFLELLADMHYEKESKISRFRAIIESGQLDEQLASVVLIIDGFSQFTADEEALIASLHSRVSDMVIGTYASKEAFQTAYIDGHVYQAGVEFLTQQAKTFGCRPIYLPASPVTDNFQSITRAVEAVYGYKQIEKPLPKAAFSHLEIWEVTNQKEEVEEVARTIRRLLTQGVRYRDILLLVGDEESYRLQIRKLFERYEIPYYLGQAEEMSHHPLVHFVESLGRIKTYRYRGEDVIHLLKTGLFGSFRQRELDYFEQYVDFARLNGLKAFSQPFIANPKGQYKLESLNAFREELILPLKQFLQAPPQTARSLLQEFTKFLERISLPDNLLTLSQQAKTEAEQDRQEEVWKAFCQLLEQMAHIFGQEKLSVEDFLRLLVAGMQASHYRTVPARVDVVQVKAYDLIEPHTTPYVFAIGLTQSHFPKGTAETGMLSDEEKDLLNQSSGDRGHFDLASRHRIKRNHRSMISLLNVATQQLVLSSPQLYNETQENLSPYLKLLMELGAESLEKGRVSKEIATDLAHYKGLLSRIIELNRQSFEDEWSKEEETFWTVALRYLRKRLDKEDVTIPAITDQIQSTPLSPATLDILYPPSDPLTLSTSSLTDFYRNEYLYFIKHVLRLQEKESLQPDARSHGQFLHRIFERVTMDDSYQTFDEKLATAIDQTKQETAFSSLYQSSAVGRLSEQILVDIARSSSLVLQESADTVQVLATEHLFGQDASSFIELPQGRKVQVVGKIDRLDQLTTSQALGVVDYKSSDQSFKLEQFFNGLSSQLVTYLAALKELPGYSQAGLFGAMYLHLQDPIIKLADLESVEEARQKAEEFLIYKGLFVEGEVEHLNGFYQKPKKKSQTFKSEDIDLLIAYNIYLYKKAAQRMLNGRFAINPYTEDGRSVAGQQLKAITGFEANRHMEQARQLEGVGKIKPSEKQSEWLEKIKEELSKDET